MATIKQIFKDWIGCVPNQAQCNALIKRYGTADEFARFVVDNTMRGNYKAIDRMLDSIEDLDD